MFEKVFCRLLLSVLILLMPLTGMAEETVDKESQTQQWGIMLGLFTRHVSPSKNTNDDTEFLGLSYSDWVVQTFSNSHHQRSFFGGKQFHTKKLGHPRDRNFFIQGNLYAGLLQGYGDRFPNFDGVTPLAMPTVGFGYKKTAIEVLYVPTPSGGVFTSFFTYRF